MIKSPQLARSNLRINRQLSIADIFHPSIGHLSRAHSVHLPVKRRLCCVGCLQHTVRSFVSHFSSGLITIRAFDELNSSVQQTVFLHYNYHSLSVVWRRRTLIEVHSSAGTHTGRQNSGKFAQDRYWRQSAGDDWPNYTGSEQSRREMSKQNKRRTMFFNVVADDQCVLRRLIDLSYWWGEVQQLWSR